MSGKLQHTSYVFFFQDEKLKKLVEVHGSEDWKLIASLLTVSSRSAGTHMHIQRHTDREVNKTFST